jgi:hypothetical protein
VIPLETTTDVTDESERLMEHDHSIHIFINKAKHELDHAVQTGATLKRLERAFCRCRSATPSNSDSVRESMSSAGISGPTYQSADPSLRYRPFLRGLG